MKLFFITIIITLILLQFSQEYQFLRKRNKIRHKKNKLKGPLPYDEALANKLWRLSILAYCPDDPQNSKISKFSVQNLNNDFAKSNDFQNIQPQDDIRVFIGKSDQGFLIYDRKFNQIIISFRGTRPYSLDNIITDLTFFKKSYQNTQVHSGFLNSALDLSQNVVNSVKLYKQKYPSAKVVFTGHSLGAAITMIMACELYVKANIRPDIIYTFGQPRVGDSSFNNYFRNTIIQQNTYYRITHKRDPVPNLPPSAFGLNFEQLYPEVYLGNDDEKGGYKICSNKSDKSCENSKFWIPDIKDHGLYYGKRLSRELCGATTQSKRLSKRMRIRRQRMMKLIYKQAQEIENQYNLNQTN